MFSSSPYPASHRAPASVYREVDARTALDGASPHKLVSLLFAALANQIANARGALARRDVVEKGRAVAHAVRILEEGLVAPLDMPGGGSIASNLRDLYDYMVQQLTRANLYNDDALLAECSRLVETIRSGWDGIKDQVPTRAALAA
jgi:flagellar secretion chaperone FliS